MKREKMIDIIVDDIEFMASSKDENGNNLYPDSHIMAKVILNTLEIYGMLPPPIATKDIQYNPLTKLNEIKYIYEWEEV
jgi:hypothetical protein